MTVREEKDIPISKILNTDALPMVSSGSMSKTLERYKKLYIQQTVPENKVLQRHLLDYILPGLAYYQILLEDGLSKEEASEQVESIFRFLTEKRRKFLQSIGRLPLFYTLLRMR